MQILIWYVDFLNHFLLERISLYSLLLDNSFNSNQQLSCWRYCSAKFSAKIFCTVFCQNYLLHYYWDTWSFILFRRIHLKFKEEKPPYWIYWFSKADSEMIFNINFVFALNLFLSSKLLTLYQFWKKFCTEDNPCLSDDGRKCNGCWIYWKPVII